MTEVVVCPLGEDARSLRALPSAIDAAEALGATLVLFRAVEDPHQVQRSQTELQALVSNSIPRAQETTVSVVVEPHAPPAIAAQGQQPNAVIVMATSAQPFAHHGYLGSAAEHVIRTVPGPHDLDRPKKHNPTRRGNPSRRDVRRLNAQRSRVTGRSRVAHPARCAVVGCHVP